MAKILLLAQGPNIYNYARQVQAGIENPDELEIVLSHMDDAVRRAQSYIGTDIEVVMARSNTADLLRKAQIPISVVKIPISNEEVINTVMKARTIMRPGTPIGFMGYSSVTKFMEAFLESCSLKIRQYELLHPEQGRDSIDQAKRDGVTVMVSGDRYKRMIEDAGMRHVLMESSVASIRSAYLQAKEILNALMLEKKKNQETQTIFNSVSDAIISLDADCRIVLINRHAAQIFEQRSGDVQDKDMSLIFSFHEQSMIRQVLHTGEESIGAIMERPGRKYAMRIVPIVFDRRPEGVVVTLQEIRALQRMEATVRKGLYQKGNVAQYEFEDIKGNSIVIRETVATARSFSRLQSNVLIVGETGTGKELFAQSIHNASPRREGPFVAVNCGAIPSHLMESELFGYEDGAFTGAKRGGKIGLFELAHSGTIFLDEISEMDPTGQVNLLRALQERQIRRVGGNNVIPVDVRIIAACNANLQDMVTENRFRRDLYYRLSVLVLELPPLRLRLEDVAGLAVHFIEDYCRQFGKSIVLSNSALRELESIEWSGNIRQLRNFCERIAAIAEEPVVGGAFIRKLRLGNLWIEAGVRPRPAAAATPSPQQNVRDMVVIKGELYSKQSLTDALSQHCGDRTALAKTLGVSRTTLWKYLKKLGIY